MRPGRVIGEPAVVEAFRVVFIGCHEVPALVPDLDPGVVAALVPPQRRADRAGRYPDGATGIDENDGQAGAGRPALFDGFLRRLVRAFPLGVVVGVDEIEKIAVEDLCCFGGGLRVLHQRCGLCHEIGAPRIARLVEHGVGQDVVEEDFLRHLLRPREFGARFHGEVEVLC